METSLRLAVKTFYDFQEMGTRLSNRIKVKSDGTDQKLPENQKESWKMSVRDREIFAKLLEDTIEQKTVVEKFIKIELKKYPIWTEWLKGVKGIAHMMASVIISEYDIYKASTVSKMWQFTGLNPGMIKGKKVKKNKDGSCTIILTDKMVRGDKLTEGFTAPFNTWLKSKMMGVLAESFIKSQSYYAMTHYYPYKQRLENSDKICLSSGKPWKEESKGHRHNAAKRHMIKEFLKDLYYAWRTLEELPTRVPYAEEYLGKKHNSDNKENGYKIAVNE